MKRLLLPLLLLALPATLALGDMPCKTQEEAFAEAVVGYFLVQQVAASRCDEVLGGNTVATLHGRVLAQFDEHVSKARTVRLAYFRRAYGAEAEERLKNSEALIMDLLSSQLAADEKNCGALVDELGRRIANGWEPIRARLQRRIAGIPAHDQNICAP
jgi:hypothetical protein